MRKVSIFLLIAGVMAAVALAGCGGGGGSSSSSPGSGDLSGGLTLTGTVLRTEGGTLTTIPVQNAKITIGNPAVSGYSDTNGHFSIRLPGVTNSLLLQQVTSFSIIVPPAVNGVIVYPSELKAMYPDPRTNPYTPIWTPKNELPLPVSLINGSTDLGTIYLDYLDSNSDGPPRMPDPDEFEGNDNSGGGSGNDGGGDAPPGPPSG